MLQLALYVTASYIKDVPVTGSVQFLNEGSTRNYTVKVAGDNKSKGKTFTDDYLMNLGLAWPTSITFDSLILTIFRTD